MVEAIISGLVVSGISVLGFIAYKHPKNYLSQVHDAVTIIGLAIFLGTLVWDAAVSKTIMALIPVVKDYKLLDNATKHLQVDIGLFFISSLAAFIFLQICKNWVTTLNSDADK